MEIRFYIRFISNIVPIRRQLLYPRRAFLGYKIISCSGWKITPYLERADHLLPQLENHPFSGEASASRLLSVAES